MTDSISQHTNKQRYFLISSSHVSVRLTQDNNTNVKLSIVVNTIRNLVIHFILVFWSLKTEKLTPFHTSVVIKNLSWVNNHSVLKLCAVSARHISVNKSGSAVQARHIIKFWKRWNCSKQWRIQIGSQGFWKLVKITKFEWKWTKISFLRGFSDSEPGQHFV